MPKHTIQYATVHGELIRTATQERPFDFVVYKAPIPPTIVDDQIWLVSSYTITTAPNGDVSVQAIVHKGSQVKKFVTVPKDGEHVDLQRDIEGAQHFF